MNRIQKLLLTEYIDFDDTVLLENTFAEITSNGIGIRQVQLAITPVTFIIASDHQYDWKLNRNYSDIKMHSYQCDPEIELLEFISVIPLEFIRIECVRLKEDIQQVLELNYCTKRKYYFEFGGYLKKNFYWHIWKDIIENLRIHKNRLPCAEYLSPASGIIMKDDDDDDDDYDDDEDEINEIAKFII